MKENNKDQESSSRLLPVLREGVGVIQMIFFKELRESIQKRNPDMEPQHLSMLTGAITNEVFGTRNPEDRFVEFFEKNRGTIEQELFGLQESVSSLLPHLSDGLRIQTLCDHQEGRTDDTVLLQAQKLGLLLEDQEIPLPSSFMQSVRQLGEAYNLFIPPVEISEEEDQSIVH